LAWRGPRHLLPECAACARRLADTGAGMGSAWPAAFNVLRPVLTKIRSQKRPQR
jgi:hypothetical protein